MTGQCRSCAQPVKWVQMSTGGRMLVNLPAEKRVILFKQRHEEVEGQGARLVELGEVVDTYTSHFATCSKASEHRRKR